MFSHIMVGANNVQESKVFYDAILGELGLEPGTIDEKGRCFYFTKRGIFAISKPIDGEPACHANGSTAGFSAKNTKEVDDWHSTGLANGGTTCENPPEIRDGTLGKLYLAYLRDPSGNKICAVYRIRKSQ